MKHLLLLMAECEKAETLGTAKRLGILGCHVAICMPKFPAVCVAGLIIVSCLLQAQYVSD
jgi:hypothetical protein